MENPTKMELILWKILTEMDDLGVGSQPRLPWSNITETSQKSHGCHGQSLGHPMFKKKDLDVVSMGKSTEKNRDRDNRDRENWDFWFRFSQRKPSNTEAQGVFVSSSLSGYLGNKIKYPSRWAQVRFPYYSIAKLGYRKYPLVN